MKPFLPNSIGKTILLIFGSFMLLTASYSQHLSFGDRVKLEAGLNFGPTFFLGDLGGNAGHGTRYLKDLNLELTKFMKGAFFSIYPTDWLGWRVAAQYTYLEGRDNIINTDGENELWRKQRNLDFKSHVWEAYTAFEIYPTILFKKYDDYDPKFRPYGFIGVGVFHFDPEGSITDAYGRQTWYKLHPLHTEGEGFAEYPEKKTYSLTQVNIPMGLGVRMNASPRVNISTELLYRKTFTDYIDDVSTTYIDPNDFDKYLSPADALIARKIHDKTVGIVTPGITRYEPGTQRGNQHQMDAYFSCVLKIGIRIGNTDEERSDRSAMSKMRCPHRF